MDDGPDEAATDAAAGSGAFPPFSTDETAVRVTFTSSSVEPCRASSDVDVEKALRLLSIGAISRRSSEEAVRVDWLFALAMASQIDSLS